MLEINSQPKADPPRAEKKIILTADDFGKSETANRNILRLARKGKLDRVSVMIDGDFRPSEIEELLAADLKLDIHLELIWQKRRRNLLRDNTVRQAIVFLVNYVWGDWPMPKHPRSSRQAVSEEWKGQVEKFKKIFGRYPDGISSHEHVHYFPAYFSVALWLADQYEIPYVRFGGKGFVGEKNNVYLILKAMRPLNRKKFSGSKISSSEYFSSLDWIGNLEKFLQKLPEGKVEIACHPEREDEFELISSTFGKK